MSDTSLMGSTPFGNCHSSLTELTQNAKPKPYKRDRLSHSRSFCKERFRILFDLDLSRLAFTRRDAPQKSFSFAMYVDDKPDKILWVPPFLFSSSWVRKVSAFWLLCFSCHIHVRMASFCLSYMFVGKRNLAKASLGTIPLADSQFWKTGREKILNLQNRDGIEPRPLEARQWAFSRFES